MFRQKDNYQVKLHLENMQNSMKMRNRYNNIVKSIKKQENATTIDQLKTAKPKKGSQDVQKLLNKILDVSKNNAISLEDKQTEVDKMKKSIEDIKQDNLRDDIKATEEINKTIDQMIKAEPLLNYFFDNVETDDIKSFKNAERRAEQLINSNDELTTAQRNEISRLMDDLIETRTMTISKGDAKAFKTGTKKYDEILSKISQIKGIDDFSPIKNSINYLNNTKENALTIESNDPYDMEEEKKYHQILNKIESIYNDRTLWENVDKILKTHNENPNMMIKSMEIKKGVTATNYKKIVVSVLDALYFLKFNELENDNKMKFDAYSEFIQKLEKNLDDPKNAVYMAQRFDELDDVLDYIIGDIQKYYKIEDHINVENVERNIFNSDDEGKNDNSKVESDNHLININNSLDDSIEKMSFKKAMDKIDLRDKENYYNVSNFKKRIKYLKDLLKATQSSSKFKTYNDDSYNFIFDDYKNLRNVSSQDINDLFASTTMLNQFFMDENAEETRNKLSGQGKSSKSRKTNNNDYFVIKL